MKPPTGHGLLDGKVIVITAAAGTGIGSAAALLQAAAGGGWARPAMSSRGRTVTGSGRCPATSPTRARSRR
jgi:NAD(P)-dependent dehydrogenase (short-subunit alcohol dehydrogenase family)